MTDALAVDRFFERERPEYVVLSALIERFHAGRTRAHASVSLWGDGVPRREFLYADDLDSVYLLLLGADVSCVELPLNVGPGEDVSIAELAALVSRGGGRGIDRVGLKQTGRCAEKASRQHANAESGLAADQRARCRLRATYEWDKEHNLDQATS